MPSAVSLLLRFRSLAACVLITPWASCLPQGIDSPVPLGPFAVGYQDTLITVMGVPYAQFGYAGNAPLFVGIWHPMHTLPEEQEPLTWRALRHPALNGTVQRVHDALLTRMDSSFIEYDLRYPFGSEEPIDYGESDAEAIMQRLLDARTQAFRAWLEHPANAPVIVYHHGSQGLTDENRWMAEYFASRGYVFVSTNFHWPLEKAMYGTPLNWWPDSAAVSTLIGFSRSLTTTDSVLYIGHSWGAQEGWCLLHEPGLVQAFVSLETTIEWKTDSVEIKDKWPHVHDALRHRRFPMPILMIADTETGPPFSSFVGVHGEVTQADPLEEFDHESYTSAYLLRHLLNPLYPQPDSIEMEKQLRTYREMLGLIDAWLQSLRTLQLFDAGRFPSFDVELPK